MPRAKILLMMKHFLSDRYVVTFSLQIVKGGDLGLKTYNQEQSVQFIDHNQVKRLEK